ncbi:MerR family transcriptional regulator [Paenibacillus selenitireducens]|jgi:DNA-binding transcriptional MerR regulator|uniref:MerR family transcriptional regulator n=1 Tax=Paenibacillus selenitireducens TaxID=1324314 RepID=A0A1T2XME4_9BACL|nr:MerR family transcriptional regulator [Paenibacillus selenitireducens]OPA81021.1 MerR family transcriptional regulator [Paenibacillus selenitireducens]
MNYTISQVAQKTNLSIYTIRYYDKEGLLPFITRENGTRVFHEQDIDWIDLICCLKNTGMPIKEIRTFIEYCTDHDAVVEKGLEILLKHKQHVEQQMIDTQRNLATIEYKIKHLPEMYKKKFSVGEHS